MSIAPVPFHSRVDAMSVREVLEKAMEYLPIPLIASTAGVADPRKVNDWYHGVLEPTVKVQERLRFLLTQALAIEEAESRQVATSWLTTANSHLGDDLPLKAIREGRHKEVVEAQELFVHGYAG